MAWRVANSLQTMLNQINSAYPNRSKRSDGSIGDASHSSRSSDHNPDSHGIVRARDFTDDPAGGFDASNFADFLLRQQDPRLKYVISDGRIGSGPGGISPGRWRPYSGSNAHRQHCHVSVVADSRGDQGHAWAVNFVVQSTEAGRTPPKVIEPPAPASSTLARVQADLGYLGFDAGTPDGIDGPKTRAALVAFQRAAGIDDDGLYGPNTQAKMTQVGVNGAFPGVTEEGNRGHATTRFQQRLKDRTWTIDVDGIHGPGTTRVIKAFQSEKGLGADGIGGPATWTALWTRGV